MTECSGFLAATGIRVGPFDTQMSVVIFVTLLEQKNLILRGFSVLIYIKECIIIVDSIFKNKIQVD